MTINYNSHCQEEKINFCLQFLKFELRSNYAYLINNLLFVF